LTNHDFVGVPTPLLWLTADHVVHNITILCCVHN